MILNKLYTLGGATLFTLSGATLVAVTYSQINRCNQEDEYFEKQCQSYKLKNDKLYSLPEQNKYITCKAVEENKGE